MRRQKSIGRQKKNWTSKESRKSRKSWKSRKSRKSMVKIDVFKMKGSKKMGPKRWVQKFGLKQTVLN